MSINTFLSTYVNNIQSIVQWLFVVILALLVPLLYFSFRKQQKGGAADEAGSANLAGIEEALKKVLENTQGQPMKAAVPAEGDAEGKSVDGAPDPEAIKAAVAEREATIAALKEELEDQKRKTQEAISAAEAIGEVAGVSKAAGGSVDTSELETKLQELEARLKEYEIIEDDIANLSLYKDENARLKNELAKLGGAVEAEPDEPVTKTASIQGEAIDEATEEEILGPLNAMVAELGGDAPTTEAPAAVEPPVEALEEAAAEPVPEEAAPAEAEKPPSVEELVAAADQAAAAEPPAEEASEDDFVGQLASVMGGDAPAAEAPPAEEPPVEAAPVEAAPEVGTADAGDAVPDVLKGFDTDKILEEATHLEEQAPETEAPQEEGDVGQKLIDEFESFMKQEKS